VAILLAATAGAIVETQNLRDDGPVVSSVRLKTRRDGGYRACFRLTRDDTVQVSIVNASDQVVRVLVQSAPLTGSDSAPHQAKAGAHCFDWDGMDASGNPVPPGVYRMRLELRRADRVATPGEHLTIAAPAAPS
jgi:flagellar hook assembly protein FlgD